MFTKKAFSEYFYRLSASILPSDPDSIENTAFNHIHITIMDMCYEAYVKGMTDSREAMFSHITSLTKK